MTVPSRFCESCGTALDPSQRFCERCGQPSDETPATPPPTISTPMATAASVSAPPGRHLPTWAWLLIGLGLAGGIVGGLYWFAASSMPKRPKLTAAQESEMKTTVFDDLPESESADLQNATNPKDLPEKTQKQVDNSMLSDGHNAAVAEAFSLLPNISSDGEIINTKRTPSLADDFSNPASGWRVATNKKAAREYADGKMQIVFTAPRGSAQAMAGRSVGNFALQIDATPVSSPPNFYYGVVLRQSAVGKFIAFLINPQGMYAVSKREDGKATSVVSSTKSAAIKLGMTTNVIKVYAVDSHFVFEVNHQMVEVTEIDGFTAGDVGVIVVRSPNTEPDPTRVTFDNFKLWAVR